MGLNMFSLRHVTDFYNWNIFINHKWNFCLPYYVDPYYYRSMVCPQVADVYYGLQIWKVTVNMLHKQHLLHFSSFLWEWMIHIYHILINKLWYLNLFHAWYFRGTDFDKNVYCLQKLGQYSEWLSSERKVLHG
jgi:hypothetical protein